MQKFGVCRINHAIFFSAILFIIIIIFAIFSLFRGSIYQQWLTFKCSLRKKLLYFSITECELKHNVSAYYDNNGCGVFKKAAQNWTNGETQ